MGLGGLVQEGPGGGCEGAELGFQPHVPVGVVFEDEGGGDAVFDNAAMVLDRCVRDVERALPAECIHMRAP